ncbi:VOC family protein [Nocardioides oleivorans]|uniref:VOC family protein n=1 Tax=Nocardioides oleivorans TaxID=273676 RepID=A0A4Q2RNF5_9ACTN|nr:VOC family protein [Nocardioides oleivorans]RYB89946.1 VOC family protein [Nocardioides oleivorans]
MDTQQRTFPEGVPSWVDLEQRDLAATQEFYGGLFGWQFEAVGGGQYVIARLDGQDVAGLAEPDPGAPPSPGGWTTYVAVEDAEAAASRVTAAGGRVVVPVAGVGPAGHMAVVEDPAGARFRLWQAGLRLGVQVANVPGAWNFSDLRGADVDAVRGFYADVLGWELDDMGFSVLVRRPGYGDHLAATVDPGIHERQAEVSAPAGFADAVAWIDTSTPAAEAAWHVSFTVADRDATAAAAERLGGTVLASEDSQWTRTAVVRDPQGATFTASQFTPAG